MFDKFSWIIVSSAFGLLLLLLLGEWAYPCSEDVVICVQSVVVEFVAVLGTSLKYCFFSIMRVPFFCLRILKISLTLFGEGFQDGISMSGVVSLQPSLYCNTQFGYPVVL